MSARLFVVAVAGALLFTPAGFAGSPAPTSAQAEPGIVLRVGGKKLLDLTGVERVAVGNPEVADVKVDGASLEVTARAAGSTQILVWRDGKKVTYEVTVAK
jgi:pilus assembly protein CpaC